MARLTIEIETYEFSIFKRIKQQFNDLKATKPKRHNDKLIVGLIGPQASINKFVTDFEFRKNEQLASMKKSIIEMFDDPENVRIANKYYLPKPIKPGDFRRKQEELDRLNDLWERKAKE